MQSFYPGETGFLSKFLIFQEAPALLHLIY